MENGIQLWNKDELGQYWLLFPNKHALTKMHVKQIFSSFGTVGNIRVAGDEKGLHFIQFSSLEEVEKAIAGLTDHPTIKLLPIRPKKKDNQNSNAGPKHKENDSTKNSSPNEKRNFYQRKYVNSNGVTTNNKSNNRTECMLSNTNSTDHTLASSKNDNPKNFLVNSNSSISNGNYLANKKDMVGKNLLKDHAYSQTSIKSDIEPSSVSNLVHPQNKAFELLKLRGINATNFSLPNSNNRNTEIDNHCIENIPDLVTKNKCKYLNQPNIKNVNAEEIIVANIHKDYGSAYILHLLEQFQPIAISYVKKLPKTDIQYCYVYFKNIHDALEVEKVFDRYNLAGKNLVVLRPGRIIEHAVH